VQKVLPVDVEMVHGYPGCWLVLAPVHDQHLVAAVVQPFHDTATDERRAAQHQDPHGLDYGSEPVPSADQG